MGNENEFPKELIRALTSLYEVVETKAKVGKHLSEEFQVKVGVHQ